MDQVITVTALDLWVNVYVIWYMYAQAARQLLSAAHNGNVATVRRLLITHGVSVNVTDKASRIFSRHVLCQFS